MVSRKQEPQIPDLDMGHADPLARIRPDGGADPAGEAGWFLQKERESRGLSLEQAGEMTGIHPYHLEAIEYGDMTRMPTRTDALEMIAAYADFLGFEPEPLLEHYITFLPQPQIAPRRHPAHPAPLSSAKVLSFGKFIKLPSISMRLPNFPQLPGGSGGIVTSVMAAFLLFSGLAWMFVPPAPYPLQTEQVAQAVSNDPDTVPASDSASDPMPTASTGADSAEIKVTETPIVSKPAPAVDAESQPLALPGLDPDIMAAFIQQNLEGVSDPAGTPIELPPPFGADDQGARIYGAPEDQSRVVLKATRSIWLLIEDARGNRIATQLLNQNDIYRVPNTPGLVATVQDGGAIKYMIDGVEKGVLGEPGSVLAAEPLDVQRLEARGT
jgi:cytoskeleton protein RodZ